MIWLVLVAAGLWAAEPGMVFIPAGEFDRGRTYDNPDAKLAWYPNPLKDDLPVRKIYLGAFYLDESEVTIGAYARYVAKRGRQAPPSWPQGKAPAGKDSHPVADVSWHDATAYCAALGKRLPTEAEWERSSRGLADGRKYPWGDREPSAADARFDGLDGPVPVCSKPRNAFGLCDMAGNVWEWNADWYGRDYYSEAPDQNPPGPAAGSYRVIRGGSWFDVSKFLVCSYRSWARPAERSPNIGFRCAKGFR
ncbi:MAG: formylglycine-generating enzyme family protein [Acidobacteria bacterium]|nr:formylglycine-generating enzyme family protein [Acidobacteriota bacterium]